MAKYLLKPITGTVKQGFILYDSNENEVYKTQMTKFKIFGASPFEFKNMITNNIEKHTVGKTVTITENHGNDIAGQIMNVVTTRSGFKFDGVKIFDYLHDKGIRIESTINTEKVGMKYNISLEGKPIATIANSSPKGKSLITFDGYYDVECDENDLDIVFLVAFAIAKTEQTFYN